jgi:hypothetical protein
MAFDVEQSLRRSIESLDRARVNDQFRGQDEFIFLEESLEPAFVGELVAEVGRLRRGGFVNRSWVPGYKKGGSVGFFTLRKEAPTMLAFYRSPAFMELISSLVGRPMYHCPDDDPHACALFLYDEPGDRVGYHYDSCHYKKGMVYTVLVGLVSRSRSRLSCHLYKERKDRDTVELTLETKPGSMVIFNGCSVYHGTTPLGPNEERVVFSMEFLLNPYMHPVRRLIANVDHAIRYFGASAFWGRKPTERL